jgi:hypothetical protein
MALAYGGENGSAWQLGLRGILARPCVPLVLMKSQDVEAMKNLLD